MDLDSYFDVTKSIAKKLFYHEHCQMKTISDTGNNAQIFEKLEFNITMSKVECCGMAGSFGYKKEYYNLSKHVGDDLIAQIVATGSNNEKLIVLASGTSCREQLQHDIKYPVYHPIEFLATILK